MIRDRLLLAAMGVPLTLLEKVRRREPTRKLEAAFTFHFIAFGKNDRGRAARET